MSLLSAKDKEIASQKQSVTNIQAQIKNDRNGKIAAKKNQKSSKARFDIRETERKKRALPLTPKNIKVKKMRSMDKKQN